MEVSRETLRAAHALLCYPEASDLNEFLEARLGLLAKQIDNSPDDRRTNELRGERKGLRFVQQLKQHIKVVAEKTKTTLEDDG